MCLPSCKKDHQSLSLADTLNLDNSYCYKCHQPVFLTKKDSLACENNCGITHFNPGNPGYINNPSFGIFATGGDSNFKIIDRPDGHSFQFSIEADQSNNNLHTRNIFSFSIDSIEGLGVYHLDTLKPTKGFVWASEISNFGTKYWEMMGAKLVRAGDSCTTAGRLQANHTLSITQWGPKGSVIKGQIVGSLFSFPVTCENWYSSSYECNFAFIR